MSDHQRLHAHLVDVIGRHLPGANAHEAANALLNYDPNNAEHAALIDQLDEAIPAAAANHAQGISPSERAALEDQTGSSMYALGPGDQKVYAALRDSNLLNAVVGRVPADPNTFRNGLNYAVDKDFNPVAVSPFWGSAPAFTSPLVPKMPSFADNRKNALAEAVRYYERAGNDPTAHSGLGGANYPQHSLNIENAGRLGDTMVGSAFSFFGNLFGDASRRAQRADEPDILNVPEHSDPGEFSVIPALAGAANSVYKGGKNLLSSLSDSSEHEWAKLDHNRASPTVPDGLTPEQRGEFISSRADAIAKSKPPTIQEYGASKGTTYSPASAWLQDTLHDFIDPFTAISGASVVKGSGGALKKLGTAAAKEAGDELSSPMNYVAALTAPFHEGAGAFKAPDASTIPKTAAEDYSRKQGEITKNIQALREMRDRASR